MRVGVVSVASMWRDPLGIQEREARYRAEMSAVGAETGVEFEWHTPDVSAAELSACDGLVVLVLSGGTERPALTAVSRWPGHFVLLAHGADNALPAALEILSLARGAGAGGSLIQARPGWHDELRRTLHLVRTRQMLTRSVLGVIGSRDIEPMPEWAMETRVRETWGVQLRYIPMAELLREIAVVDDAEARHIAGELKAAAQACVEPNDDTIVGSARLYCALKSIVARHRLSALTVRCFDLLTPVGNTSCYGMARLNDEGIPTACEADIGSAITMMISYYLTGSPGFMTNPAEIDPATGRVFLAHCTIPTRMCECFTLRSHYESGLGVGIEGTVGTGRATLVRVGGPELREVYAAAGTLVDFERRTELCRTQVLIELDSPSEAARILSRPLGNHHIVLKGDHADVIRDYADFYLR
ncbi:MAG: hypothetical protein BWY85_00502 [Firmicutes bacterium ADurb.Bin506]|jgi:L-fucose isomerase-like protein|nr:MAG: hypothetical protein BWY85_00502 [Firmicutes bacterium ADurb.Bin506]